MTAPQTKERPASMLRAMFASFGSLMSVVDKIRSKPAAEAPADAEATAPEATEATEAPTPETTAPETTGTETTGTETTGTETTGTETTGAPDTVAAETDAAAEPAVVVVETAAVVVETTETDTEAEPETAAEPAAAGALPLANYDELTVASLRARLRNLSNNDITLLLSYEEAHQNRPEVIKMFRNRLIKMTSGLPKLEA